VFARAGLKGRRDGNLVRCSWFIKRQVDGVGRQPEAGRKIKMQSYKSKFKNFSAIECPEKK